MTPEDRVEQFVREREAELMAVERDPELKTLETIGKQLCQLANDAEPLVDQYVEVLVQAAAYGSDFRPLHPRALLDQPPTAIEWFALLREGLSERISCCQTLMAKAADLELLVRSEEVAKHLDQPGTRRINRTSIQISREISDFALAMLYCSLQWIEDLEDSDCLELLVRMRRERVSAVGPVVEWFNLLGNRGSSMRYWSFRCKPSTEVMSGTERFPSDEVERVRVTLDSCGWTKKTDAIVRACGMQRKRTLDIRRALIAERSRNLGTSERSRNDGTSKT